MAYPQVNWRKLSFAVFDAHLRNIRWAKRCIEGSSDQSDIVQDMADNDNRQIMVKRRFRYIFPRDEE